MQIQQNTINIINPQMPFAKRAWGVEKRRQVAQKKQLWFTVKSNSD